MINAELHDEYMGAWIELKLECGTAALNPQELRNEFNSNNRTLTEEQENTMRKLCNAQWHVDEAIKTIKKLYKTPLQKFYDTADEWDTGGGCKALVWHRNHVYVMVTEEGGCEAPGADDKHVSIGLYIDVSEEDEDIDIGLGTNCIFSASNVSVINLEHFIDLLLVGQATLWCGAKLNHGAGD